MPYATQQDLIDRLGEPRLIQLTDINTPATGAVDATVVARALEDASGEIDGYLAGRYALPLATPPAILKTYCCSIAHYRLLGSAADEVTRDDYRAAIKYLTAVSAGTIPLMPPADAPVVGGVGPVLFDHGTKVMGRDDLAGGSSCRGGW